MQVGQVALQQYVLMGRAGDVAGAARTGAIAVQGRMHGVDDLGAVSHSEVIVAAPDRDRPGAAVRMPPDGGRECADITLKLDERPVTAVLAQLPEGGLEHVGIGEHRPGPREVG